MAVSPETIADAMYDLVAEYQGRKKFKAGDLIKAMIEEFDLEMAGPAVSDSQAEDILHFLLRESVGAAE